MSPETSVGRCERQARMRSLKRQPPGFSKAKYLSLLPCNRDTSSSYWRSVQNFAKLLGSNCFLLWALNHSITRTQSLSKHFGSSWDSQYNRVEPGNRDFFIYSYWTIPFCRRHSFTLHKQNIIVESIYIVKQKESVERICCFFKKAKWGKAVFMTTFSWWWNQYNGYAHMIFNESNNH